MHCKDNIPKVRNIYSQKRDCAAIVPIPTFMFVCASYIFPQSFSKFCCSKIGGPLMGIYINRSQTKECGNRAIPFLGIHKSKFLSSVVFAFFSPWFWEESFWRVRAVSRPASHPGSRAATFWGPRPAVPATPGSPPLGCPPNFGGVRISAKLNCARKFAKCSIKGQAHRNCNFFAKILPLLRIVNNLRIFIKCSLSLKISRR